MEGRNESSIYQRRVRPSQEEEICYFGSSVGKSVYEVQCREKGKKDQNKLFQALQVLYIYSVPLDSRVKLVQSCRVALSSGYLVRYFYFESELVNRINFMIHFSKLQSQNQNEWV